MDYKLLSATIALIARERGASINDAVTIAQEAIGRIAELPEVDVFGVLMVIEQEFRNLGYGRP